MNLLMKRKKIEKSKRMTALMMVLFMFVSLLDIFFPNNTVNAASDFSVTVSVSSDAITENGSVTLTAKTGGGGSGFTYKFWYNKDGGSYYSPLNDYSSNSTYILQTSKISDLKDYTGPIYVLADAKSNSGVNHWSSAKVVNVMPKDETELQMTGTINSSSYTVGDTLTVSVSASGGKSPYQYQYQYKKVSDSGFYTYKGYSSSSSITMNTDSWTANEEYTIC